ncbi:DedA family protein [bacterium]|nr:DedA family protein [bacterium]NBX98574.1 DedA family protein [bacterium]NDC95083.1 DedA family protein [bacterium]NDD84830.1 DedA family protein [bacterium]NDG29521.1 DedA family protein [bacterium]
MGIDPSHIIQAGGVLLVAFIVFAESGLLIGFFLPGDTLLFTAGFFASQGQLHLGWLLFAIVLAAIIGDNVGYTIGQKTGNKIFKKKDGIFFRQEYIVKAEEFYEKHGGKTITLARFLPIIRTFAPVVAGVGNMNRKKFMMFNIAGALLWGVSITLLGYYLGSKIPNIDKYLLPAVLIATVFTFAPPLIHVFKDAENRKKVYSATKQKFNKKTEL